MRYGIFADIHGNWEALQTASHSAAAQGIDQYIVLGDTVGYGASPNECLEWVVKNAAISILGNHERAIFDDILRAWFHSEAAHVILWTSKILKPDLRAYITELPHMKIEHQMTFVHGSPYEPERFHYILNATDAQRGFKQLTNRVGFIGHTHVPVMCREWANSLEYLSEGVHQLEKEERYILNPGSIGQPRDRDLRLSYGIFDSDKQTFEIVRLDYDSQAAAQKILQAGLPERFARRILELK